MEPSWWVLLVCMHACAGAPDVEVQACDAELCRDVCRWLVVCTAACQGMLSDKCCVCSAQMASETFASRKQDLRERQSEVDAQARFLDNEGANNKEVESRIAYYDREVVSETPPGTI